ncbi:peptidoglycan DD-metalloendopeptidase family protein [Candidatus Saccharibacteria bacterium]|nr:peptidoglycan DD-metalloendopeptidase family protein [Candidatus Saccharibacteria bacterium]
MKIVNRIFKGARFALTSPFGQRISPITGKQEGHSGADYGTFGVKAPQYALEDGHVTQAGRDSTGAIFCRIYYERIKKDVLHYHLDQVFVRAGDKVTADTIVGNTGTTGLSTGIHLHLGLRTSFTTTNEDPERYDYQPPTDNESIPEPSPAQPSDRKSNEDIAREIWFGVNGANPWGNNPERRQKLEAAGYDARAVQDLVDKLVRGEKI